MKAVQDMGRNTVRGVMIPGLRVTIKTDHYTFAEDAHGCEWYIDISNLALVLDEDGIKASMWSHSPVVCPKCSTRAPRDFPRPMGVVQAESRR